MAYYRDINFFTPTSKSEVLDAECVRQELAMLFNTRPPEKLFDPEYGVALDSFLFDLISQETADRLFVEITSKVKRYVNSISVDMGSSEVVPDPDNNRYILNIFFNIKGANADGSFQMTKTFVQP